MRPMAFTVPAGMAAWPPLPQPRMRTAPFSSSKVMPGRSESLETSPFTRQVARSGMTLWATPPSNSSRLPARGLLTSSPLKPPFSPLHTGNSASGEKQKAGAS